jgi:hypothetical protein
LLLYPVWSLQLLFTSFRFGEEAYYNRRVNFQLMLVKGI